MSKIKVQKKKRLYIDPIEIAKVIARQVNAVVADKEVDPEGLITFTNEVATRNIAENIAKLFTEEDEKIFEYDEDGFNYWEFMNTTEINKEKK